MFGPNREELANGGFCIVVKNIHETCCSSDAILVSSKKKCDVRCLWDLQGRTEIRVGTFCGEKRKRKSPFKT